MTKTAAAPAQHRERQLVRATYAMDTATFTKHFTMRHADSLAGQTSLPDNMAYDVEMAYRAFHKRLHETRPASGYEHVHSDDPPEAAIEWCLFCLRDNRKGGWHEIAGVQGGVVGYFPDADNWATKVNGVIAYHEDITDVVTRLLQPPKGRRTK